MAFVKCRDGSRTGIEKISQENMIARQVAEKCAVGKTHYLSKSEPNKR